jgi:hypothetical protein
MSIVRNLARSKKNKWVSLNLLKNQSFNNKSEMVNIYKMNDNFSVSLNNAENAVNGKSWYARIRKCSWLREYFSISIRIHSSITLLSVHG